MSEFFEDGYKSSSDQLPFTLEEKGSWHAAIEDYEFFKSSSSGLEIAGATMKGCRLGKPQNDDSVFFAPTPFGFFAGVFDGVGGGPGGDIASRVAGEAMIQSLFDDSFGNIKNNLEPVELLKRAMEDAHNRVKVVGWEYAERTGNKDYKEMSTTATVALFTSSHTFVCHLGDSKAYVSGRSGVMSVTNAHVRFMMGQNMLYKGIGINVFDPDIHVFQNSNIDYLVLVTDGIGEYVTEEVITHAVLCDFQEEGCLFMSQAALDQGSGDDLSSLILKVPNEVIVSDEDLREKNIPPFVILEDSLTVEIEASFDEEDNLDVFQKSTVRINAISRFGIKDDPDLVMSSSDEDSLETDLLNTWISSGESFSLDAVSVSFSVCGIQGHRKSRQDDCAYGINPAGFWYFIISDGMGGGQYGDEAAQCCVTFVKEYLQNFTNEENPQNVLNNAVSMAHMEVKSLAAKKAALPGRVGATLLAVLFVDGIFYGASVGDSQVYVCSRNKYRSIVPEQTVRWFWKKHEPRFTDEMLDGRPDKDNLAVYVGMKDESYSFMPYFFEIKPKEGEAILFATDGLVNKDGLTLARMQEILLNDVNAQFLVQASFELGSTDNITAMMIRYGKIGFDDTREMEIPNPHIEGKGFSHSSIISLKKFGNPDVSKEEIAFVPTLEIDAISDKDPVMGNLPDISKGHVRSDPSNILKDPFDKSRVLSIPAIVRPQKVGELEKPLSGKDVLLVMGTFTAATIVLLVTVSMWF